MAMLTNAETEQIQSAINLSKTCLMCHGVDNNLKEEAISHLRKAQTAMLKAKTRKPKGKKHTQTGA